jgi:FkbM family methyltransferase
MAILENGVKKIYGIPIVSPDYDLLKNIPITFIASRHSMLEIKKRLNSTNLTVIGFDEFFVARNLERISCIKNNFSLDQKSQVVLDSILMSMMTGVSSFCKDIMENNQYFATPHFANPYRDIYVDAGAYVGDTIEKFIWASNGAFRKIYAFEPGFRQFVALKNRIERLTKEWAIDESQIVIERQGLATSCGVMGYANSSELMQSLNLTTEYTEYHEENLIDRSGNVSVCSLDDYLCGREVTFIKADVEGMEMDMLHGSQATIKKYKPKLAISVYHYPTDIFEIPEFIHKLNLGYKFAIRHHSPVLMETVLYCWID